MSETEHEQDGDELEQAEESELEQAGEEEEGEAAFEGAKTGPEQTAADEAAAKARDKALTAEDKRHNTALGKIFGQEWPQHVRCALCDGIGFLEPQLAAAMTNEQWSQVLAAAIAMTQRPYIADSNYQRCEHCDGWGQTLSHAQDPEHFTKLCDVCSGNGYIQRTPKLPTPIVVPDINNAANSSTYSIPSYGSPAADDAWGRPGGHPHYGIPPAAVQG